MFFPLAPAALLALAIHSASASPVELSVSSPDVSPNPLQKRFGFLYRFYNTPTCNHAGPANLAYPVGTSPPLQGMFGFCYSAPTGTNWQRVETNTDMTSLGSGAGGIITYCNVGCKGSPSNPQRTYCSSQPAGCAIGSFRVADRAPIVVCSGECGPAQSPTQFWQCRYNCGGCVCRCAKGDGLDLC